MTIALASRREALLAKGEAGRAASRFEVERHDGFRSGLSGVIVPREGVDDVPGGIDLEKGASLPQILAALDGAHHAPPLAAHAGVLREAFRFEVARAHPLHDVLRLGEELVHEVAGRV